MSTSITHPALTVRVQVDTREQNPLDITAYATEGEVQFHQYRSAVSPQSIQQTLAALQVRCGLHVIWAGSREGAARAVERLVRQFVRGIEKDYRRIYQTRNEADCEGSGKGAVA